MSDDVSFAQIVAALSVTYRPSGVVTWLQARQSGLAGFTALELIGAGRPGLVVQAIEHISDCSATDFTVYERVPETPK